MRDRLTIVCLLVLCSASCVSQHDVEITVLEWTNAPPHSSSKILVGDELPDSYTTGELEKPLVVISADCDPWSEPYGPETCTRHHELKQYRTTTLYRRLPGCYEPRCPRGLWVEMEGYDTPSTGFDIASETDSPHRFIVLMVPE